jgi:hypothetical protein
MSIDIHWSRLLAVVGGAALASRLARGRDNGRDNRGGRDTDNEKPAQKAELHDWENEGGTPAPSPEATDAIVTAGSA